MISPPICRAFGSNGECTKMVRPLMEVRSGPGTIALTLSWQPSWKEMHCAPTHCCPIKSQASGTADGL